MPKKEQRLKLTPSPVHVNLSPDFFSKSFLSQLNSGFAVVVEVVMVHKPLKCICKCKYNIYMYISIELLKNDEINFFFNLSSYFSMLLSMYTNLTSAKET